MKLLEYNLDELRMFDFLLVAYAPRCQPYRHFSLATSAALNRTSARTLHGLKMLSFPRGTPSSRHRRQGTNIN
jgi:hypothetical protein